MRAKIIQFDERTWWGVAKQGSAMVEFHGTTVSGMRHGFDLVGRECELLFNDSGDLFDVRIVEKKK